MAEPALQAPPRTRVPRPDPARGVFETLLVLDGRPIEWDAHIARLHASLATLYPDCKPPSLDVPSESGPHGYMTSGTSVGAMRIAVAPEAGSGLRARASVREVDPKLVLDPPPVALSSVALRGGLGAHKWADRSLLGEAQAKLADDELPLIVDEDGAALEAARANLFAVCEGTLLTPPLDGRVLPGITRMRVLETASELGVEAREAELRRDDLLAAEEVFLTGSVRGVEPAASLDDTPLPVGGELTRRLAASQRRATNLDRSGPC